MKRVLLGFILATFTLIHSVGASTSWPLAEKLMESVVYLESVDGSCTGFVIDSERHYILTAAHCDGKELFADQEPTKIISKDVKSDLMIIEIKDCDKPALKLAAKNPEIGDEVASIGFGYGLERPMFRVSHVSDNKGQLPELSGSYILIDTAFVPGQSGGPVVNEHGEVIMIVQMASDRMGIGRGAEQIKAKVGKYFEKK